jgi:hypothetical protein
MHDGPAWARAKRAGLTALSYLDRRAADSYQRHKHV